MVGNIGFSVCFFCPGSEIFSWGYCPARTRNNAPIEPRQRLARDRPGWPQHVAAPEAFARNRGAVFRETGLIRDIRPKHGPKMPKHSPHSRSPVPRFPSAHRCKTAFGPRPPSKMAPTRPQNAKLPVTFARNFGRAPHKMTQPGPQMAKCPNVYKAAFDPRYPPNRPNVARGIRQNSWFNVRNCVWPEKSTKNAPTCPPKNRG